MNQEFINQMKENKAPVWYLKRHNPELLEAMKEAHEKGWPLELCYIGDPDWCETSFIGLDDITVYRLKPDFEPPKEPKYIEVEIGSDKRVYIGGGPPPKEREPLKEPEYIDVEIDEDLEHIIFNGQRFSVHRPGNKDYKGYEFIGYVMGNEIVNRYGPWYKTKFNGIPSYGCIRHLDDLDSNEIIWPTRCRFRRRENRT